MSLSGTSAKVRVISFRRYISPGLRWGTRRRAIVSAAEGDGAQARMCTSSFSWETSCIIASITVFVFPVPGGPDIKNGRSPCDPDTIESTDF